MTAPSEAEQERDRVLAEVEIAHAQALTDGLEVLRKRAGLPSSFSANDVRDDLRAVGLRKSSMGALFNAAKKAGIIRAVGWEMSDDIGTHRKLVLKYVGCGQPELRPAPVEAVTVPVRRDVGGRFSAQADEYGTEPLFDLGSAS